MNFLKMLDQDLANKRVLIREDLNVPLRDGVISNDARLRAAVPTLRFALDAGARIMVMSHLGRPKEGEYVDALSLRPVADYLSSVLEQDVQLVRDPLSEEFSVEPGQLVLFENVRFFSGEGNNEESLAKALGQLCDVFVMDAFGTAHRRQASTYGVAKYAPLVCAGPLLVRELEALTQATENPRKPVLAIVGGAKVSTKIGVLDSLANQVDRLIVGGGIANTFLLAAGKPVGQSLVEREEVELARRLMSSVDIPLPTDVVVAKEFSATAEGVTKAVDDVAGDEMILDIGPDTQQHFAQIIASSGTIIWNGPVGVFEFQSFSRGTSALSEAIASSSAFSLAGGGDTLAAIDQFGVSDRIDYISTGGGAFLEFLEGKVLPAVEILTVQSNG